MEISHGRRTEETPRVIKRIKIKLGDVMTKILLVALALLFATAWLQAQDASQSGASDSAAASAQTTLQGCLQGADGSYMLTDKFGRTYQLGGDTSRPAAYVGREVQVTTSTPAAIAIASSAGAAESGAEQPILTVVHVKSVSGTCQAMQ